jgi:hypothetical protein
VLLEDHDGSLWNARQIDWPETAALYEPLAQLTEL